MACTDTENSPQPGDTENVLLRKLLNRLCNVTSGGGSGVSQAYVDARDAATLASANANAVAGDVATLAAAMSSASALYVLKSGDTMTGALLLPNGAVGAPSLSHTADANTGLWYPAADTIAFSTAGAERVRFDSSGLVGIGTTSPIGRLSVGLSSAQAATPAISLRVSDAPTFGFDVMHDTVVAGDLYVNRVNGGVSSEVIRLQRSTGNIGVGVTPLAKLHVTPAASGTDYFRIDHSDGTPRLQVGVYPGNALFTGLWAGNVTPTANNEALISDGATVYLNAQPSGNIYFSIDTGAIWRISGSAGHFLAGTDNTYDIGASGATRPRNVYVAGNVFAGGGILSQSYLYNFSSGFLLGQSDGVWTLSDIPGTGVNRLQFGGTTASFPSIKRSSATLQARLADDSAFADVSVASIRTNNAAALVISSVAMNDGAAAALGTLTNAPAAGNPTKWIPINDNGTTRYIPAW